MCDSRASENMSRNEETSSQESRYKRTILYKTSHLKNPKPFEGNVNPRHAIGGSHIAISKNGQKSPRNTNWPYVLEKVFSHKRRQVNTPKKADQKHGSSTKFYHYNQAKVVKKL